MRFERDCNILYSYSVVRGVGDFPSRALFLSSTTVDKGESICRECKGTGLWLNATTHLFQGFKHLKPKLYDTKKHPLYDQEFKLPADT